MALPKKEAPVKATRTGPKILILYSLPKCGKTEQLVELAKVQDCLILDTEGGTDTYDTTKIHISSTAQIDEVVMEIIAEGKERAKAGKKGIDLFPYKFIALDTFDKFEEYADTSSTYKYRTSKKNANGKFEQEGYTSVREMANGYGYQYLYAEMLDTIDKLGSVCAYLILVVHVKEKLLMAKEGIETKINDLALTGKLASQVAALADAIGYMYRTSKGELKITFKTYEGAIMGARQKYLAGQDMEFSWSRIYPELFESQPAKGETEVVQITTVNP